MSRTIYYDDLKYEVMTTFDGSATDGAETSLVDDNSVAVSAIEELLEKMKPQQKVLRSILSYCRTPQKVSETNEYIDALQSTKKSVYTAADLCALLERSGGLVRIQEVVFEEADASVDQPLDLKDKSTGKKRGRINFWVATEAALEVVDKQSSVDALGALIGDNPSYEPIYRKILSLCSKEKGATTECISEEIDEHPAAQNPRRYATFFIEQLESCDAVVWDGSWKTTETGKSKCVCQLEEECA